MTFQRDKFQKQLDDFSESSASEIVELQASIDEIDSIIQSAKAEGIIAQNLETI